MNDREALRLGRRIVAYTKATRKGETFPLTGGWVQRISRRLGQPIGRDRAYTVQHALIDAGEIEEAGSYPHRRFGQLTGFKVKLWRTGSRLRQYASSVPDRNVAWWKTPLGGGYRSYPRSFAERLEAWKETEKWFLDRSGKYRSPVRMLPR